MLELEATARGADGPVVEVAVDAPGGPGPRTYTYLVPAELGTWAGAIGAAIHGAEAAAREDTAAVHSVGAS